MKNKTIGVIIVTLLITTIVVPCISGYNKKVVNKTNDSPIKVEVQDNSLMTCYAFGKTVIKKSEIVIPLDEAEYINERYENFNMKLLIIHIVLKHKHSYQHLLNC